MIEKESRPGIVHNAIDMSSKTYDPPGSAEAARRTKYVVFLLFNGLKCHLFGNARHERVEQRR